MEEPRPIPAAASLLWSQFRARALPLAVFAGLIATAAFLWTRHNSASSLTGLAEGVRTVVSSPQAGRITEVKVRPYQLVNQGDPIAVVQPVDPRMPLELIQTSMQLARMRYEPSLAQQNAMDYQRVRLEFLRLKSELAVSRVELTRAENDLKRNRQLFEAQLLSEDLYDLSLQTREALLAEVKEKEQAVLELEHQLESLRELGDPSTQPDQEDPFLQALCKLEEANALSISNSGPITLVAPASGMVTPMFRQEGEMVLQGEPLMGIQAVWSDRVVAYLRQPYPVDPEVGMQVKVTTRTRSREQFALSISHVGAQVEAITNALAFVRQGALVDVGLPIIMDLPAYSRIRPGEQVDLWIDGSARSPEREGEQPATPEARR